MRLRQRACGALFPDRSRCQLDADHDSPCDALGPDLFVPGTPYPKGSGNNRLIRVKGFPPGVGRLGPWVETADQKTKSRPANALKKWSKAIREAAGDVFDALDCPVEVRLQFRFERIGKPAQKRSRPTVEPDIDKLSRAVLDALNGVAFRDDSRVVDLRATKVYAETPGVAIRVRPLTEQPQGELFT